MMLTILCVTQALPYAMPFLQHMDELAALLSAQFVVGADGEPAVDTLIKSGLDARYVALKSKGYVESVLDTALTQCEGRYVLRLDDDERCSPHMVEWLRRGLFLNDTHWKFPRMHLWPDTQHYIAEGQLWPDHQTRLSLRIKAGGRTTIHAGSPFGGGTNAGVALEHHKFLVRSRAEREETARRWHGTGMTAFSLPEDVFENPRVLQVPM